MSKADKPTAQTQDLVHLRSDLAKLMQQIPYDVGETILDVLRRVDQLGADLKLDAKLQHYLERRSYQKALDWLADPQQPHQM